jgi:hypothetical protein
LPFRQLNSEKRPANQAGLFISRITPAFNPVRARPRDSEFDENILGLFAGELFDGGDAVAEFL